LSDIIEKIEVTKICQRCGTEFTETNQTRIKKEGSLKYCSNRCRIWKNNINYDYFRELDTKEKIHTFGQIISLGRLNIPTRMITIAATIEDLNNIKTKLESDHKITKAWDGLYKIEIKSHDLMLDLLKHGMNDNFLFQDVPRDDIFDGLLDTYLYYERNGIKHYKTESSKIARWVCDKVGGVIETRTFMHHDRPPISMWNIVKW